MPTDEMPIAVDLAVTIDTVELDEYPTAASRFGQSEFLDIPGLAAFQEAIAVAGLAGELALNNKIVRQIERAPLVSEGVVWFR